MIVLVKLYAVKVKANDYQFQGSRNQNQLIQKEKGKFDLADEEDTLKERKLLCLCALLLQVTDGGGPRRQLGKHMSISSEQIWKQQNSFSL